MHELSVCQALLRQVDRIAQREQASAVRRVSVRVGVLSGVEPALLAQAFRQARTGSPLAQRAQLLIETVPVRVRCAQCGAESGATAARLRCPACHSTDTCLVAGHELLLAAVDVIRAQAEAERHV
jgi:hydrogenase nickel incorporation protein HypA/HybF